MSKTVFIRVATLAMAAALIWLTVSVLRATKLNRRVLLATGIVEKKDLVDEAIVDRNHVVEPSETPAAAPTVTVTTPAAEAAPETADTLPATPTPTATEPEAAPQDVPLPPSPPRECPQPDDARSMRSSSFSVAHSRTPGLAAVPFARPTVTPGTGELKFPAIDFSSDDDSDDESSVSSLGDEV